MLRVARRGAPRAGRGWGLRHHPTASRKEATEEDGLESWDRGRVSIGFLFYKLEPMEFGVEAWNSGFAAKGREKDALTSLMTRDS